VGVKFTVTVDTTEVKQPESADISMIGPGYDLVVEDVKIAAGEADTITFSPDGKTISYKPSSDEAPNIVLGIAHPGADYQFQIKGAEVEKGVEITASLDYDKGELSLKSGNATTPTVYGLVVDRIDDKVDATYNNDELTLAPGATAIVEFGKWDGKGDLSIGIDEGSNGSVEKTESEPNKK